MAGSLRDGSLNSYSHYGSWSVDLAAPGIDIYSLGVDTDTASGSGTVISGPLPERSTFALPLTLRAHALLEGEVTARLVASAEGADYLNVPYNEGEPDETGFLAWRFEVVSTAVWSPADTGAPADTADTGAPVDSGGLDTTPGMDSAPAGDSAGPAGDTAPGSDTGEATSGEPAKGCGCGGAGTSWVLGLLGAAALRRRALIAVRVTRDPG